MDRAPLTFRLVSALCGVREGEHAGQQAYLSSEHQNEDSNDSVDELANVEEAWDEGDSWRDDGQFFLGNEGSSSEVLPAAGGAPNLSNRKGQ